jgi:cytochrome c oxidase subunit I+III
MMVLMVVAGSLYLAFVFSYLYLWTGAPEAWEAGKAFLPDLTWPIAAAALLIGAAILMRLARASLPQSGRTNPVSVLLILCAAAAAAAGIGAEFWGHWSTGLRPTESSYGASVYMSVILGGQIVLAICIMSAFCAARHVAGKLDRVRVASLENTALLLDYMVAQTLIGLLLIHGFPRVMGAA